MGFSFNKFLFDWFCLTLLLLMWVNNLISDEKFQTIKCPKANEIISTFSKYDISMIQWITYRQQQMVSVQRWYYYFQVDSRWKVYRFTLLCDVRLTFRTISPRQVPQCYQEFNFCLIYFSIREKCCIRISEALCSNTSR